MKEDTNNEAGRHPDSAADPRILEAGGRWERGDRRGGGRGHGHHDHGRRGKREHQGDDEGGRSFHSAQTFRRGRVLMFLERMQVMRSTLMQQLNQPEFQPIQQVITGELKAVDQMIQEYIHTFELREMGEGEVLGSSPGGQAQSADPDTK
ncbi:hypothetical protein [Paenibacillus sp. XY044]|uniref:hypothetical protein n=1 Tax=Paenibacillus sp. XY044 TaxID=2026089 RepID=UPI000B9816B5|nr:hypothetical protein [Paenibacillus sp. XY044]OZB93462.1 hypothetical protein CJP46_20870 [Paenibacillus sp. XY044]